MIEPAGSTIDRLVPELRSGGFMRVKSSNYHEEFKRGDVTVAYSCGRYGEELMCFVTDACQFRFQMSSYVAIVDPPAAAQSRANGRENDVDQLDFDHTNYAAISNRYYLTMQALLSSFLKNWPSGKSILDGEAKERMKQRDRDVLGSFGLSREQTYL
ncbi:hypothetical protein HMP09_0520 [Sphingomonas sp. HMP9]|uniref:hypothetical protein n=1 Tax=Sphingomonas sp. HMP9 TaxID=1517554 RepID=UPI00159669D1|nr:hypothetical protein [Sphingomonas sp. HMP9]BCA61286.1 hypothetical protein HMP09_0520 [Sphingomonas sp. HMP9]